MIPKLTDALPNLYIIGELLFRLFWSQRFKFQRLDPPQLTTIIGPVLTDLRTVFSQWRRLASLDLITHQQISTLVGDEDNRNISRDC